MSTSRCRSWNRRLWLQALEERAVPATFVVSNNADSGAGSLRQALSGANGSPGADTVDLTGVSGVIAIQSSEFAISEAVTITGPGAGLLSLSGNGSFRVFNSQTSASKSVILISGVTLTGGKASSSGGAMFVGDESVTLSNCTVTGNTTTGRGGGLYVRYVAGSLTLQTCVVSNNTSGGDGGGLSTRESSPVIVQNSTFSGNAATGNGGGINLYVPSTLLLENCTVSNNKSTNVGGGLLFRGNNIANELIIRNSTFTGNSSPRGGGIALRTPFVATIQNTTVTGNTATTRGGGIAVVNAYANGTTNLESTILSGNVNVVAPDISGYYSSNPIKAKNCAIGSNVGVTLTDLGGNLPFGINLKLGNLANNGGPTQTFLPAFDSPLLNAGSNPAALTTDQRGPGYARTSGAKTDIGAVEIPIFSVTNADPNGTGSLRQAILDANALSPSPDLIIFDPATFANATTITLAGEFSITDSLVLIGPGSQLLTVNGDGKGRVFNVNGGAGSLAVGISGLTITGGSTLGPGGGIFNQDEALTLTDCVITGNQSGQGGGGIFVQNGAGSLTLQRCVVSNNQVTAGVGQKAGDGGAINVLGNSTVLIDASSITGNTAKDNGGGLYFFNGGNLTLTNSTVSGNIAKFGSGGGMYFMGVAAGLVVRNSTLSGNTAQLNGGGLYLANFVGTALIQNSTIANNTATTGTGGGIARGTSTGSIGLESTIVSGNTSPASPDIDSAGTVTAKTSAIGSIAGFTITDQGGNLPIASDLKLGSLADNGGPTQTHLPLLSSPLINSGSNPAGLSNDQRGVGFFRTVLGQSDIGAAENQNLVVTSANNAGSGSLRQAVIDANNLFAGASTITFEPILFGLPQSITLMTGEIAITDALTVKGPGSTKLTIHGNSASRIFSIDKSGSSGNAVAFSGMTITGGKSTSFGGAIFDADENLTLTDCAIVGNQSSVAGGGIFILSGSGSLTLQDCAVSNNAVTAGVGLKMGDGGGINLQGASNVVIDRSTISGNTANENGGGIYFYQGGNLTLTNSTISGNTAKLVQGGGIFFYGVVTLGQMTLSNSTISGNSAKTTGGGLSFVNLSGACAILNCTVTNNTANTGFGGGIARTSGSGIVSLVSSIVSGNFNANAPDIYSNGNVAAKFSAIGSSIGFTFGDLGNNLAFGANLKLSPLASNGGPTQTHAIIAGSPCIDAGSNPSSLTTDQRGTGFVRPFGPGTDIGAFEYLAAAPKVNQFVINDGSPQRSRVTGLTLKFDTIVMLPAEPESAFQLKRQSDGAVVTLSTTITNVGFTTIVFSFAGGPVEFDSLADGRYTFTALANSIFNLGGALDANGDGANGDDFVVVGDPATNKLFRLFGDADGNGLIDLVDFGAFRAAFNTNSVIFAFDGSGPVGLDDFGQFRVRFGMTV